jgi:hypothetical protein
VVLAPEIAPFAPTFSVTVSLVGHPEVSLSAVRYDLSPLTRDVLIGTSSSGSSVPVLDPNATKQLLVSDVAIARIACGEARAGDADYELEVAGHLAGAVDDPAPLRVPLRVDCAQARIADRASDPRSDEGGGCSVSTRAPLDGAAVACALLGSILRRRRRR